MRLPYVLLSSVLVGVVSLSSACGGSTERAQDAPGPTAPSSAELSADTAFYAHMSSAYERVVQAVFAGAPGDVVCQRELVAGCVVSTCTPGAGTSKFSPAYDPGAVSASSPSLGGELAIPLTAGMGRIIQQGLFTEGEQIRLKAAGGADFPTLDELVTVPEAMSVLAVDGCTATNAADQRCALQASGAHLDWSGARGARVDVSIATYPPVSTYVGVKCSYDGAAASGWLPRDALARLAGQPSLRLGIALLDGAPRLHAGATHAVAVYMRRWPAVSGVGVTLQ